MAVSGANDPRSHIYLGLAGETGTGRLVQSGLFRLADGGTNGRRCSADFPRTPAVRALVVHPLHPEIVYAGTQPDRIAAKIGASTGRS